MGIRFNGTNHNIANCMALFMAKVTNEVYGQVLVTFMSHDDMTLRITHDGYTSRHRIDHADVLKDPEAAALKVLVNTSPKDSVKASG